MKLMSVFSIDYHFFLLLFFFVFGGGRFRNEGAGGSQNFDVTRE